MMQWLPITREQLQRLAVLQAFAGDECEICGCTDDRACPGGCAWVAPGLCSSCAGEIAAIEVGIDQAHDHYRQASRPEELGP